MPSLGSNPNLKGGQGPDSLRILWVFPPTSEKILRRSSNWIMKSHKLGWTFQKIVELPLPRRLNSLLFSHNDLVELYGTLAWYLKGIYLRYTQFFTEAWVWEDKLRMKKSWNPLPQRTAREAGKFYATKPCFEFWCSCTKETSFHWAAEVFSGKSAKQPWDKTWDTDSQQHVVA